MVRIVVYRSDTGCRTKDPSNRSASIHSFLQNGAGRPEGGKHQFQLEKIVVIIEILGNFRLTDNVGKAYDISIGLLRNNCVHQGDTIMTLIKVQKAFRRGLRRDSSHQK